ncbi:MAG: SusD/RagB family nutrient-binding outer membrane lipoprotein [Bacteroidota bacterium]
MQLKNIIAILVAGSLLLFTACDEYLDINENPNVATQPPLDGLLASTSYQTGLNNFRVSNSFGAFWVQYLASPNESSTTDIYLEADYSGTWGSLYNTMTDLFDLIRFGEEREAEAHVGIAKVLMAVNLALVVDNWNDAPYTDAFTGSTLTPVYDNGEQLYDVILNLLGEAEAALASDDASPSLNGPSDFVHGGDLVAWGRTIEALRARYLNHLSETGAYAPAEVLNAIDNAYTGVSQAAAITTFEVRNPWAQQAVNNDALLLAGWLSDQFVDALNGTTYGVFDPRLPFLTDTTDTGDYRGTRNGAGRVGDGTMAFESYLETDGSFSSEDSPLYLMSYQELKFVEAEAALAATQPDRALTAFTEGVTSSIIEIQTFAGVSQEVAEMAAADYLSAAYPDLSAANLTLDDVFREKYVANFLSPETYVDARRYDFGYTGFELAANAAQGSVPTRVQYPNTELDRNGRNTPDVLLTDLVFWDQ